MHQYRGNIRNKNQYRDNNNNNNNYHNPNNTTTNKKYLVLYVAVCNIGNTSGGTVATIINFKKTPV